MQGDTGLIMLLTLLCLRKGMMSRVLHTNLGKTNTTRVWEAACLTPEGAADARLDLDQSRSPATVPKRHHTHAQTMATGQPPRWRSSERSIYNCLAST